VGYQSQDPAEMQLVGGLLSFEPYGIGIAKGNDTLKAAVNAGLTAYFKSGDYAKSNMKWLHTPPAADANTWFGMDAAKAGDMFLADQKK
jgi:ABC-type amino acid transport substrate-binding protein